MTDLVTFLNARYDEEAERWAVPTGARRNGKTTARRMQAEIAAKRQIIEWYVELRTRHDAALSEYSDWLENKPVPEPGTYSASDDAGQIKALEYVLRLLATAYADHADYDDNMPVIPEPVRDVHYTAQMEMTDRDGPTFRITLRADGEPYSTLSDLSTEESMKIWAGLFPLRGQALEEPALTDDADEEPT